MKLNYIVSMFFVVCAFIFLPAIVSAQDPGPNPDIGVPFDAGISLMIAAGLGYAAKKKYDQKKNNGDFEK